MAELWKRGTITLTWPVGHEFHGLEIEMRRRPLGEIIDEWLALADHEGSDSDADPRLTTAVQIERNRTSAADFAALVVRWNLAGPWGEVAPFTGEGLLSVCDAAMISAMWRAYNDAANRVAPPLSQSSNAGPVVTAPAGWDMGAQEVLSQPG